MLLFVSHASGAQKAKGTSASGGASCGSLSSRNFRSAHRASLPFKAPSRLLARLLDSGVIRAAPDDARTLPPLLGAINVALVMAQAPPCEDPVFTGQWLGECGEPEAAAFERCHWRCTCLVAATMLAATSPWSAPSSALPTNCRRHPRSNGM
jgi:hypothetical protein